MMPDESNMRVKIIDTLDEWKEISVSWNDLLGQSSSNTIFLTWEWLYSWAECFLSEERKLFILAVYKGEELVGIAPWCICHGRPKSFSLKKIVFMGTPEAASDYLDVFSKKGKEKEVAETLYNYLLHEARSRWDSMILNEIPSNSLFILHFLNKMHEERKYSEVRRGSFCPIASLPKTVEEFYAGLTVHRKKRYKRDLRIVNDGGCSVHQTYSGMDAQIGFQEFIHLLKDRKGNDDERFTLFLEKFVSRSREKDWVQIDSLLCNNKVVASLLHLRYQDTLSLYHMATDKTYNPKVSLGNVLVGLCIEKAIAQEIAAYDFLKGAEEYKFYWSAGGISLLSLLFCKKKIAGLNFILGSFIRNVGKIILR